MQYKSFWLVGSLVLVAPLGGCYTSEQVFGPGEVEPGEYVIGLDPATNEADLIRLAERRGLVLLDYRPEERLAVLADPSQTTTRETLDHLQRSEHTSYAEPQFIYRAYSPPNDYGDYLWGLHNTGLAGGVAGADVSAFEAWERATGDGVVVAIMDTGVDSSHPDLFDNMWRNVGEVAGNGIDDDDNGYVDDVHGYDFVDLDGEADDAWGHGTHVAGIAAAVGDDGYGVPGLAYRAQIMALKFLDVDGGGYASQGAAAIRYAVDQGADVINMSFGGPGYSYAMRDAIEYALDHGVMVSAAAGNESSDNTSMPSYPANYELENVLSVAATDRRDRLSNFTNYGDSVHVAAPGSDIVSTWPGEDWKYLSGTSMAAPFVAGAIALLRELAPQHPISDLRSALLETVQELPDNPEMVASGGRLDTAAALAWAVEHLGVEDEAAMPPAPVDEEAPVDWTWVPNVIESSHPYTNFLDKEWSVEAPANARELRLLFGAIEVEEDYDWLRLSTAGGVELASWTGAWAEVITEPLPYRSVVLQLETDYSVTDWGFIVSGYSWR